MSNPAHLSPLLACHRWATVGDLGRIALEVVYGGDERAFEADAPTFARVRAAECLQATGEDPVAAIGVYLGKTPPPPSF